MFHQLTDINKRPKPYEFSTVRELWTDPHRAEQMLAFHLDESTELASRPAQKRQAATDWLMKHFAVGQGSRVCDFGCGPGLYATAFAQTGARVSGVDFSANSLGYARAQAQKAGLSIDYIEADYLEFKTEQRFDLITLIYYDFCALSPDQRAKLLSKFRELLAPGGRIVLDVLSLNAFAQRAEVSSYEKNSLGGFWSAQEYYGFLNTFKYEAEKLVLDKHSIIEAERRYTVYNWLQYFDQAMLEHEFAQAGLKIEQLLDDLTGQPYTGTGSDIVVVAKVA
ncbi:SAM-dependent methyltransferase [Ferrimonas marina]|uniref:Methyltransferase domain-containing protein n=1 Tax=Ferrimonas marina TaxID=299255 RepID=A0A1M5MRV6_9GAMM|nr:class I SAM-dependent methyltransferase [Ferrimonas marina]SHG79629.1 Methyltransferase domain-containing protein [Ferrimonas marina]